MTAAHVASLRGVQQGHSGVVGQCFVRLMFTDNSTLGGLANTAHILWYMSWYLVDAVDCYHCY